MSSSAPDRMRCRVRSDTGNAIDQNGLQAQRAERGVFRRTGKILSRQSSQTLSPSMRVQSFSCRMQRLRRMVSGNSICASSDFIHKTAMLPLFIRSTFRI